jgi:hypothetical protein
MSGVCSAEVCGCPSQGWAHAYDTPLVGNMAIDPQGALYLAGGLGGSVDFGAGPVTTTGSSDVYVAKMDPATGLASWSAHYGDVTDQNALDITANATGEIAIVGTYTGTLDFGGGVPPLVTASDSVFVAGLKASNGDGVWAKDVSLGGGSLVAIATDPTDGSFLVAGTTGSGATANFGSGALASGGGKDVVIAKLAANTGAVLWAKQYASSSDQIATAITVDAQGNPWIVGQYSGAPTFGTALALPMASAAQKRIFLVHLDTFGATISTKSFGTTGQQQPAAVVVDATGVVVAGAMVNTVDFGSGAPLVSAGAQDAFAVKLAPDGATTLWAARFGDASIQAIKGAAIDGAGHVVLSGLFQGSMDMSPIATLTSAGAYDAFLVTLDGSTGAPLCAKSAGDASDQAGARVALGPAGRTFVLGTFISSISWGGAALTGTPSNQTFFVELE